MYPEVLVLSTEAGRESQAVESLRRLGVKGVLEASSGRQAMAALQGGGVILCDLDHGGMDLLEHLHGEHQLQQAAALTICGNIDGDECRRVLQIVSLAGLQFLGALASPLQPSTLQKALRRYKNPDTLHPSRALPPGKRIGKNDVQRGLDLGEFALWLQPTLEMNSGAVIALEAAPRWHHPRRGLLLPQDFLPAVLAYDLFDELFRHVFESGMKLLKQLTDEGQMLELVFNLQASQLNRSESIDFIEAMFDQYGIPGAAVVFGIAENELLDTPRRMRTQLHRLYKRGCKIAIDDFGSGFMSLKQLCQFPIARILLGREFTHDLSVPRNRAVVLSVLSIAESLDIHMVARDVGTEVVRDNLLAMGCTLGQGVHFAQPMPIPPLIEWLARRALGRGTAQ